MEIPMLDEAEYAKAAQLYRNAFHSSGTIEHRMQPLLDYYKDVKELKKPSQMQLCIIGSAFMALPVKSAASLTEHL